MPASGSPTRVSRWDRVAIIALGGAAFAQSFDALRQMAGAIHVRSQLTWLFPLLIDGFIAYGIRALLVLRDARLRARVYAWSLVGIATATSVWANSLHAVRLNQQTPTDGLHLGDIAVGVLSMAAPLAIAGAVHLYIVLARDGGTPTEHHAPQPTETGPYLTPVPAPEPPGPDTNRHIARALPHDTAQPQPHPAVGGDDLPPRSNSVLAGSSRESDPDAPTPAADSPVESPAMRFGADSNSGPSPDAAADSVRVRARSRSPRMQAAASSRPGSGRGPRGPHRAAESGTRQRTAESSRADRRTAESARTDRTRRVSGRRDSGPRPERTPRGEPVSEDTLIALARTAPRLPDGRLSRKQIATVIRTHGHRISNDRINGLMAALRDDTAPN
ncbi:hypothetical protein GCM10023205_04630 [Yinghuangia aomiensis]|uniref:DUF2637 domain-containing protein n=1 Tax=Yinghuangia aomiensis TaxID=676205 RepID=A0ABP9GTY3_9ACTN